MSGRFDERMPVTEHIRDWPGQRETASSAAELTPQGLQTTRTDVRRTTATYDEGAWVTIADGRAWLTVGQFPNKGDTLLVRREVVSLSADEATHLAGVLLDAAAELRAGAAVPPEGPR